MRHLVNLSVVMFLSMVCRLGYADIVINEFQYDDTGGDTLEFVELYNNGGVAVDISGWTVGGRDATTTNPTHTIPGALGSGTTMVAPVHYVLGNTAVGSLTTLHQTVAADSFENDTETIELRSGTFAAARSLMPWSTRAVPRCLPARQPLWLGKSANPIGATIKASKQDRR